MFITAPRQNLIQAVEVVRRSGVAGSILGEA
jgi:hypothetical protein